MVENDFTLRTPEATGANRHMAMTQERLNKYSTVLGTVLEQNSLTDNHVWNMDETSP